VFIQKVTEKELLRVFTKVKAVVKAAGLDVPVRSAEVFSQWTGKGNDDVEATEPLTAVAKAVDFIGL
jgi:exo-beta-1,3-glucanase (GH17 family)